MWNADKREPFDQPITGHTAAVRAGVEDNRHSEVEHPDAWAHRNLDDLDRAYATECVRFPPVQAVLATKEGHPHWGAP